MVKVFFFGSKKYVFQYFNQVNIKYNFQMSFEDSNISLQNAKLATGFDVVCVFVNDYLNSEIIQILKKCGVKLIALRCAGFNNIDIQAANDSKIPIVRVPAYSPYAVAEYAFSLILALNRKTHKAYNRIKEGNFDISGLQGFDLYDKNIGVVGVGNIGEKFINIAKGFGLNVLANDINPNSKLAKEVGFKYVPLEELFKESDIIALHCPLTKDNYHCINKDSLSLMKNGVMIINTSRGGLINAKDLVQSIKKNKVGSVALDVYEEEQEYFFNDYSISNITDDTLARLLSFNNVLITSHQAFFTREALINIADTTMHNIYSYFIDKKLINSTS